MSPRTLNDKQLAIIVDLDETLCTQFDVPVKSGVALLRRIDQSKLQVHYVTARTGFFREDTQKFIAEHRLPGLQNVHLCPDSTDSFEHKRSLHQQLNREFRVIASIGDSLEEQQASAAAGIHFVEVDPYEPAAAWVLLEARIAEFGGFKVTR